MVQLCFRQGTPRGQSRHGRMQWSLQRRLATRGMKPSAISISGVPQARWVRGREGFFALSNSPLLLVQTLWVRVTAYPQPSKCVSSPSPNALPSGLKSTSPKHELPHTWSRERVASHLPSRHPGDIGRARETLSLGLKLAQKTGEKRLTAQFMHGLGCLYFREGNTALAIQLFDEGLELAKVNALFAWLWVRR